MIVVFVGFILVLGLPFRTTFSGLKTEFITDVNIILVTEEF